VRASGVFRKLQESSDMQVAVIIRDYIGDLTLSEEAATPAKRERFNMNDFGGRIRLNHGESITWIFRRSLCTSCVRCLQCLVAL
jgi:hypothetical protein